ncbi:MAG: amidase [Thermomicrobiales bacterium]|nr:amidase [Thermomicrobiales bacterium]
MSVTNDSGTFPDLVETAGAIARREVSPVELIEATLRRIEALNPILNAYITVLGDQARVAAKIAEREIAAGAYRGPLHGIPVSVKDLFWTKGVRTTGGSRLLADFVPEEDATIVARLRDAGAILVAKANLLELAYAVAHPDYGPTKNPWGLTRTASGSSGGSAAAVAAGMDFGSFGSDTAGSIRLPASFCGAVGFKPSFGRVSRYGLHPLSWSLDFAGPLGRSVRDVAVLLQAVAGQDPRDRASAAVPVPDYTAALSDRLDGIRVGFVTNVMGAGLDPEIDAAVARAIPILAEAGATIQEIAIPELEGSAADAAMAIIVPEATHSHREWLETRPNDYSPTVLERLLAGRNVTAVDYLAAKEAGERFRAKIDDLQREIDLFVLPTMPVVAMPLDETTVKVTEGERGMTALNHLVSPFNLAGHPALTLPCGFTEAGLPIGLQLVGRHFEEDQVLTAGHAYQLRSDWHGRRPPVAAH